MPMREAAHPSEGVGGEHFGGHVRHRAIRAGLQALHNAERAQQAKVGHLGHEAMRAVARALQQHVACAAAEASM